MRERDLDRLDDPGLMDKVLYELLSAVGGEDLQQSKRKEIRKKRKEFIEEREIMGGPPFTDVQSIEVLVELGLKEAKLIDGFDPDLLIVSEAQYKSLFDVPAAVHINPDKWPDIVDPTGAEKQKVVPPKEKRFGEYHIDVVYSKATNRMLLADSSGLSTRTML